MDDENSTGDEHWTEWFYTTLATNVGHKEIRKPTLKRAAHPLLRQIALATLTVASTPLKLSRRGTFGRWLVN